MRNGHIGDPAAAPNPPQPVRDAEPARKAATGQAGGAQHFEFKEVFKKSHKKQKKNKQPSLDPEYTEPRTALMRAIILATAYFACAVAGMTLAAGAGGMTLLWPARALLLTALIRTGLKSWPACLAACFLAAFAANALYGEWLPAAGGLAAADVLETAVAAYLIRRVFGFPFVLDGQAKAIGLFALGGIITPAIGASVGAGVAFLTGHTPFLEAWMTWWIRAAASTLMVAPALLCWTREFLAALAPRQKSLEFALMAVLAAAIAFHVIDRQPTAVLYVGVPILMWAAVRLGPLATAIGSLVMTITASISLVLEPAPLANGATIADNALMLFNLAALVVPAFMVAIIVHEREQSGKKTARAHRELTDAIEGMPVSFVQYDAEERVIRWNSQAAKLHDVVKDKMVVGTHVEDIIRSRFERIFPDDPKEKIDQMVSARLKRFHNPGPAVQERLPNGRWSELYKRRTADGGTVSIRIDISARKKAEKRLNQIAKSVSGSVGEAFLGNMLTGLLKTLGADNAFLCQRVQGFAFRIMIVAAAVDNDRWRGLDFDIVGTPHAAVMETGPKSFQGWLGQQFPSDPFLGGHEYRTYLGVPLGADDAKPSGILFVLARRAFKRPRSALALIRVFAGRAAAEIERLQAESEMLAVKSRMEQILTAAGEGIFGLNVFGETTFVNPAAARMLGWRQDELVGRNLHGLIHDGESKNVANPIEKCPVCSASHEGRDSGASNEVFWRKDGSCFPVEYTSTPIRDDGIPAGAVIVFRDVTERNKAEEARRESEQRFRDLIEGSFQGILIHRDDEPLFFNDSWARIHGYAPEEMAAFGSRQRFVAPHERERLAGYASNRVAGKEAPAKYEYQALKKDGSLIWVENLARVVTWNGQPAVHSAIVDVTERKLSEIQGKEHQAELTHANRLTMLGEMATGLAHELNQPLSAIANYAQGTARRLKAGKIGTEMVLESVEKIAGQALRAGGIIRKMRDFARKEIPQKTRLDVNALVREAIELLQSELHGQDITVNLDLGEELPWVMADGIQIQQVVLNVTRNGWEAMRDGNAKHPVLSIKTHANGEFVKVSIQDTGPGILDEIKENIFTPFFSTKTGGLGMGLAISRSIIDEHGGEMTYAALPSRGTVVHFTLPIHEVVS